MLVPLCLAFFWLSKELTAVVVELVSLNRIWVGFNDPLSVRIHGAKTCRIDQRVIDLVNSGVREYVSEQ